MTPTQFDIEAEYSPLELARFMHNEYERLAPNFGYETREDTREFDPNTPNGKLMVAVMAELIVYLDPYIERQITEGQIDEQNKVNVRMLTLSTPTEQAWSVLEAFVADRIATLEAQLTLKGDKA